MATTAVLCWPKTELAGGHMSATAHSTVNVAHHCKLNRLPFGSGELSPSIFCRLGCGWGRWRGEVLLVDCRSDHINCCLNIHYSLDVIFCLASLVTARQGFS
jgi:hypothetical protein